ncbi:ergothioneine biosynthesis protein EgtB [Fictibacillus sp. S7]|uniref:ergothioneine biosynthesis protein EgtB n=1 Tax=Fictibacillus sp. S7 TaxID=2212476 RepID=UPI0010121E20|nr:ergothioneine biosynthesis protein EgtB [Fictibacillus sp. S7]RXY98999.1 ergothioneine biosynthesis protein EgtB [Fictibacillus sp. S7]
MSIQKIDQEKLANKYSAVRSFTERLVQPLNMEDFIIQSMEDASPPKWHLAHTTWFFERFLLKEFLTDYNGFDDHFDYLFNSYYETAGPFHPRIERGLITRPSVEEVFAYRKHVDKYIKKLLMSDSMDEMGEEIGSLLEIGLNHEQQHQELLLTDIKYNLSRNPFLPAYQRNESKEYESSTEPVTFIEMEGGLVEIGNHGKSFCFDNEKPVHKVWLDSYRLATRPVTNDEFCAFIEDGGYKKPQYWLSDGWSTIQKNQWEAPLYWFEREGEWCTYTLAGEQRLNPNDPVCHVSFYEADAFARWSGKRLPTEEEWENAFSSQTIEGNLADSGRFHPQTAKHTNQTPFLQAFGDVWEWTKSPYVSYPGNKPYEGTLGEYNAKFMCNQMVLRGGSCATPASHIRATYRNFFQPEKRWQFSGFRLAGDIHQ